MRSEGPSPGYVTVLVEAEIDAGALIARHTHPGIGSTYIIEGGGTLIVDGQANREVKPGDGLQIPAGHPHGVQNGPKTTKIVANYIVEKGKPLASPA